MFGWIFEILTSNLPSWLWPVFAAAGAAIYFFAGIIGNFPTFKPYTIFIRPAAALIVVGSIFMYGGAGISAIYEERIAKLKQQIAEAQVESAKVNTVIETKIVHDTETIHDTKTIIHNKIQTVKEQINKDCKLDPVVIEIVNKAALNPLGDKK